MQAKFPVNTWDSLILALEAVRSWVREVVAPRGNLAEVSESRPDGETTENGSGREEEEGALPCA